MKEMAIIFHISEPSFISRSGNVYPELLYWIEHFYYVLHLVRWKWHFRMYLAKGWTETKRKNSCERSCKSHSCGWDQEPVNFVLQFSDPAARLHSRAVSWFPILWMLSYLHAFIFFHWILFVFSVVVLLLNNIRGNCRYLNRDLQNYMKVCRLHSWIFPSVRRQKYCHSLLGSCSFVYCV